MSLMRVMTERLTYPIETVLFNKTYYRVSQKVSDLGWVDLDLACSTTLLGQ